VDATKGSDAGNGSIDHPFKTLDKALAVVAARVKRGRRSDKIYLRAGVYRKSSSHTLYHLELKGTPDDYSLISAMPCKPGTPGGVESKSGKWYERVVFDDAQVIHTVWNRVPGHNGVWATHPGYTRLEWTQSNLWPWRRTHQPFPITDHDSTPATTLFTVAPYMLLQDGKPTVWEDSLGAVTAPGLHSYDQTTGTLYVFPFGNKDPDSCKIETWYGGPEEYEKGMLYLDGEGRALFNGNMEYAGIVGCEFRMFVRLFEFHRQGYKREADREIQRHVKIEDNMFAYGWIQFLLDANTIFLKDDAKHIYPHYKDRSNWVLQNNIFYRPSREVFQVYGADNVFEDNAIIDHNGPWAGPAACVGMLNARNMDDLIVRNNYIVGQGNNRYAQGSVFMIEVGGQNIHMNYSSSNGHRRDSDFIFKGPTYESNLIAVITSGPAFVLGKGGVRMGDITIKDNIIATHSGGPAIQIASPQKNLKIENNVFYDQSTVIAVVGNGDPMKIPARPSHISVRDNMFIDSKALIDKELFDVPGGSTVAVDHNLFYDNTNAPVGENYVQVPVVFTDPKSFDFRVKAQTGEDVYKRFGPFEDGGLIDKWRRLYKTMPKPLPVNSY
jgi:hypothetical protein